MRKSIGSGIAALLAFSAAAGAQVVHTPAGRGNIAGIAPASSAAPAPRNGQVEGGFRRYVPVAVAPDGRVYADFGHGYEQVTQACGGGYGAAAMTPAAPASVVQPAATQPTVSQPSASQPGVSAPLPYTPAVPAQQTAAQRQANGSQIGGSVMSSAGQSCWANDGRGNVIVIGHP